MTHSHADRISLVVITVVTGPVATGLLWAGATGTPAEATVTAIILVVWFAIALPLAMWVGRFTDKHMGSLPEEES